MSQRTAEKDGPPREDAPATPPWTDADRTKFRVFVARVRDNPCQNGVATDPTKEEG